MPPVNRNAGLGRPSGRPFFWFYGGSPMRYNSTSSVLREIRSEMNHDSNEPSSSPPADAGIAAGADGATLDGLADGFLSLDRDWRVRYLNPAAERLLRRSRLDLVGHGLWDSCPDLVGTGYYDACRGAMQTGQPTHHTGYYAPLASWFEARAFPHERGLTVLFRDVSREREATAQLKYQATHN